MCHDKRNGSRMRIPIFQSSAWAMRFCDVAITRSARVLLVRLRSGAYFFCEIDLSRIQKKAERSIFFRYLAFIFRLSCHHKVRWARLIDSYGRGTWHAVARVCDVQLRHALGLILKIVTVQPYIQWHIVANSHCHSSVIRLAENEFKNMCCEFASGSCIAVFEFSESVQWRWCHCRCSQDSRFM